MSLTIYITYTEEVITRVSVDEMVKIWFDAAYFGAFGRKLRARILLSVPALCRQLKLANKKTFRGFVHAYDYSRLQLSGANPEQRVENAINSNDWRLFRFSLRFYLEERNRALYVAAKVNDDDMIDYLIDHGAKQITWAIYAAVEDNNKRMLQYFLESKKTTALEIARITS